MRRRAPRRLFARVLDAPGGMKIQTIHAFCQSLLRRFPLEAGIAPHFDVLDERSAAELLVEAREEVLERARGDGEAGDWPRRCAMVTRHVGRGGLRRADARAGDEARAAAGADSRAAGDAGGALIRAG